MKDDKIPFETKMILEAELDVTKCAITHFELTAGQAVAFISQQFRDFTAVIPVCQVCAHRLDSDDWILLYCVSCNRSIWIFKPESLKQYHYGEGEHIKWMNECQHCYKEE